MIRKAIFLSLFVFNLSHSIQIFVKPYYELCYDGAQGSVEIDFNTATCGELTDKVSELLGGGQIRAFRLALDPQAINQDTEEAVMYEDIEMPSQIYFGFKYPERLLQESMFGPLIFDKARERCVLSVIFEDDPLMGMDDEHKTKLRFNQLIKRMLEDSRARAARLGMSAIASDTAEVVQTAVEYHELVRSCGYSRALARLEQLLRERGFNMLDLDDDLSGKLASQFYLDDE